MERALKIYLQLGLVELMTDGAYYMSNIELLIGQSFTEGERKKQARMALREQKKRGGHLSDIRPPEIEIVNILMLESHQFKASEPLVI